MPLLEEFKEYLRLDGNDQDLTLNTFLSTSRSALEHSGVRMPLDVLELDAQGNKRYPLHFLAIIVLAAHYYENRIAVGSTAQNIVPFSVQHMILQLKLVNPLEP